MATASLRFLVAGVMLFALLAWKEPASLRVARRDWPLILGLGLTGVAAYNLLSFFGVAYAPATDGAMISPGFNPVLTAFAAALLFREPLSRHKIGGLGLALLGIACTCLGPLLDAHSGHLRFVGDMLFVASAVTWSAYTLLGKLAVHRFSPLATTTYASLAGLLFLVPFSWHELAALHWGGLSLTFWGCIVAMAALCTVASFLFMFNAIRVLGPSRASSFNFLVPLFGVLMGVLALGERPSGLQWLGMGLTLAGVWVTNRKPAPRALPNGA